MRVERICQQCGMKFLTQAYRLKTGRGLFCSRPCSSRFHTLGKPSRAFKGGRIAFSQGYIAVLAPGHPNASVLGGRYVLEHRKVASEMLGRPLTRAEVVHHKNGNKADNRPENLQVMTQAEHVREHGYLGLTHKSGEENPRAKLSDFQVRAIRAMYADGATTREISTHFGICMSYAWVLVNGFARRSA